MASSNNMAAATRRLGRAESTLYHDTAAAKLFSAYRRIKHLPEVMSPDEIEGEKLQEYVLTAGNYFANRCIARYFNGDLEPSNPENLHCLMPGTLVGYIGKHLLYIRTEVAPNHPDFRNRSKDDYPTWYTSFRSEFENACNRFQLNHNGDEIFSGHDTQPLYRSNDNGKAGNFPHAMCDLKRVMISLYKHATRQNQKMEQAAWICDTADAVGRPGECKFGNFSEWYFDWLLNCPNTPWSESKTLKKYGMCRICDDFFGFDWFCNMGAFFMCQDGLARDEDQVRKGQMNAVFPSLQVGSNNNVTKKLTNAIRSSLDGVPNETRKKISAKSIRKGMITEIAMASFITLFMVVARTGHATGAVVDAYLDVMNPLRSLPAANALHGNALNMKPVMPNIDAVGKGNRQQVEKLMDALFLIGVPDFQRGQKLNIILETCFASMIRHLPEIVRLCGGHCLFASTLFNAAEKIGLTDARFPGQDPKSVLLEWSKMVGDDYKEKFDSKKVEAMGSTTQDSGAMYKLLSHVAGDVKELKDEKKDQELEVANLKAMVAYQNQENRSLKEELKKERARTKSLLNQFYPSPSDSPTTHTTSKRRRQEISAEETATTLQFGNSFMDALNDDNISGVVASNSVQSGPAAAEPDAAAPIAAAAAEPNAAAPVPAAPVPAAPVPAAPVPAARPPVRLAYSNDARQVAEGSGGNANETLKDVLKEMAKAGMICASNIDTKSRYPDRWHRHRASLFRCLELVAFAGDEEDMVILERGNGAVDAAVQQDIFNAACRLEKAAHEKMLEFEGTSLELNAKEKRPKQPVILGLAMRILTYKKRCWEATGKQGKDSAAPLIELDALREMEKEQQSTPPNHRNVMSYFN